MMIDTDLYEISTKLVEMDGESYYEARVRELPDVREYADTREAAVALAVDTIETTAVAFKEIGKQMPDPIGAEEIEYSGRVTLRLPKHLHRSLAITANIENVSLNSYLSTLVSYNHGMYQVSKSNVFGPRLTVGFEAINSCYSINNATLLSAQWTAMPSLQRDPLPDVSDVVTEIKVLSS